MAIAFPRRRSARLLRCRLSAAVAILFAALQCLAVTPPARAQTSWDGTVEVSLDGVNPTSGSSVALNFNGGNSVTYWIRLSKQPDKQPSDQKWWVRIHVDGGVRAEGNYKGFSWVPSVGREFDRNSVNDDNPTPWRGVVIRKRENIDIDGDGDVDADDERARPTSLTFSHEVWDHNADCPIHNVGVVTVYPGSGNNNGGNNNGGNNRDNNDDVNKENNEENEENENTEISGSGNNGGRSESLLNNAPVLNDPGTLTIEENVGSTAKPARNVGNPVTATDDDSDPLTFTLEGPNARYFTIGRTGGQIRTRPGVVYDHETRPTYTVTVKVSDGRASDTIDVTINVEDLPEVPRAPAAPKVRLVPDGQTGLSVRWKAPPNRGRPPITGYDLEYRTGPGAPWMTGPQNVADTSALITSISDFDEELPYEVQVRAKNDEGDGPWSPPGRLGTGIEGDTVQTPWIVRFARTVSSQVLDAVTGRLNGGSETQISLGGLRTDRTSLADAPESGAGPGQNSTGWREAMDGKNQRNLLPGSSFQLSAGGDRSDVTWTAWGRFGTARFDARKNPVALFGNIVTTVVGADVAQDRWLGGMAISVSGGEGVFELAGDDVTGKASGRLTNVYGYARYRATDKVDFWGILGYGAGTLNILEDDEPALSTDLGMRMAAFGLRGELPSPDRGLGIDLAVKADAMWVQAESAAVGDLFAARGEATRFRLTVEGSRAFRLRDGTLTLTGEAGLRQDGGNADKGIGLLVGGGVGYRAESYTVRGSAHGVLAHAEEGFGEWGVSGSVRIDPGLLGRGFFLTVAPRWGAAPGGIDSLQSNWGTQGPARAQGIQPDGRLEAEIGYGMRAPMGAGVLTPHAGLSLSLRGTQQWRAGAQWRIAPQTALGIEGTRDMTRGRAPAGYGLRFRASSRW